ncbi:tRNA-dihydrouridine synthase family protein [Engelhardtia mirabilis]|uniref:tRNA-dihydrouridine synthase C n=1 Tax=Engelhardtia mirabilis TaxID=2528011 RepID=A0A518BR52_9BACT|nr:tRNA-dihydrouridine synthase C [Planctomycetes bacterium Pla133]QDV03777.1 tRNA-dihydrouridine synthase C [Planctomycetes bacterium Pla86]
MSAPLPFTGPYLLAPMQGVTEACFRDLVLDRNPPELLGGAFTEFARVVDQPMQERILRAHLGPRRHTAPVGLQLMGADLPSLAATTRRALEVGAPLVDLNFGCPSKGALRGCAGSALLEDPRALELVVRVCVDAAREHAEAAGLDRPLPVTAKIRAGGEDDTLLEDLAGAAEAGGATLLTVHCRTRAEAYRDTADWERLRRAVGAVSIPVCGNGGVWGHADLSRLLVETGCTYAMVGRAALADPWVFAGVEVDRARAAAFLIEYAALLAASGTAKTPKGVCGRLKQLLVHWTAGDLVGDERTEWLRIVELDEMLGRLEAAAQGAVAGAGEPV